MENIVMYKGKDIKELSRGELIEALNFLYQQSIFEKEQHKHREEFLFSLIKPKRKSFMPKLFWLE